jgi:hypothetical protein
VGKAPKGRQAQGGEVLGENTPAGSSPGVKAPCEVRTLRVRDPGFAMPDGEAVAVT